MSRWWTLIVLLCSSVLSSHTVASAAQDDHALQTVPASVTSLDPRFDQLVPKDAKLEKIAEGFTLVEGPVWHKQDGYLLFSDIPANSVYKWKPGEGVNLFVKNSGYSG